MSTGHSTHNREQKLRRTPLYDRHVAAGGKMVPFAGYEMPVQYELGVLKEHLWTRENAGLFDVSHMGQAELIAADGSHETVARFFETLVPADILNLAAGRQRYTQLLNAQGGIIDDLMVMRPSEPSHAGGLFLIVNAARKAVDFAHIESSLPKGIRLETRPENALLALQGPAAGAVVREIAPDCDQLSFMSAGLIEVAGVECLVSRSGYTGEDGLEIVVQADSVGKIWDVIAADARVRPIGLGARDSLRLEAGLCLYGHDIDETTSPIEAALAWSIQKRRRLEAGFPGAERITSELRDGPSRVRVGLRPAGRAPAREGTEVQDMAGRPIGRVTSGGFGPSVAGPIAMGYVSPDARAAGTEVRLVVRGKPLEAHVVALPFVAHRYRR